MPRAGVVNAFAAVALLAPHAGFAQDYPTKSVRIVTGEAGGSNDFAARIIATGITGPLGQTVIVDNRTGGVVAVEIVSRSVPDGHTLLMFNNSMWTLPLTRPGPPSTGQAATSSA
jgi:tripartite-type tricarboxylate transporter receptor subunit TctC